MPGMLIKHRLYGDELLYYQACRWESNPSIDWTEAEYREYPIQCPAFVEETSRPEIVLRTATHWELLEEHCRNVSSYTSDR